MHKSFFPLFIISLVGILAASQLQNSVGEIQWVSFATGIIPLVIYHVILWRKHLLSPTEVDSIYYFGFLITVITLVSTALSIGLSEGTIDLRWILFQFGLGLVATGYALFARLQLLAKSTVTADTDIVDATERLAKSVEMVAGKFDTAGFQVDAFVERTERRLAELEQRTQTTFTDSEEKFKKELNEATLSFNKNLAKAASLSLEHSSNLIKQTTDQFSEAISAVMKEIGRVQTEAETISFQKASERITKFAEEMEQSVAAISGKVSEAARESAGAVSELTSASRKTMKLATDISAKLENLKGIDALTDSIDKASGAISGIAGTAAKANDSLSSLAENANITAQRIREYAIKPPAPVAPAPFAPAPVAPAPVAPAPRRPLISRINAWFHE